VDVREFKKIKRLAISEQTSQKYFTEWIAKLEMSLIFDYEYFTLAAGRKGRPARLAVLAASVVTLVIYLIPHSLFGSELKYTKAD
jgi:hypothetical protein